MTPLSSASKRQTTCHMAWDKSKRSQMWLFVKLLPLSAILKKQGRNRSDLLRPYPISCSIHLIIYIGAAHLSPPFRASALPPPQ